VIVPPNLPNVRFIAGAGLDGGGGVYFVDLDDEKQSQRGDNGNGQQNPNPMEPFNDSNFHGHTQFDNLI